MIIEQTMDPEVVKQILTSPEIYEVITKDGSPKREDYEPDMDGIFIAGYHNDNPMGLMIYKWKDGIQFECHFQVLEKYREHAEDFARQSLAWLWTHTNALKVVAEVPCLFPKVISFAIKMGFVPEGVNRMSHLKGGILHDQTYLGLNRPLEYTNGFYSWN